CLSITRAALLTSISPDAVYDFVIVGGGTAGNVIANRLTENPNFKILVLEAGGTHEGNIAAMIPFFGPTLTPNTPYDWNYTTTPQAGLGGRSVAYPRGYALGGCSAVSTLDHTYSYEVQFTKRFIEDFLMYTRGPSEGYDEVAKISGDSGWSWENLQPYFRKNEKWTAPADNHDTTGQFDPAAHSLTGINSVSLSGFPTAIDGRIIKATTQLGPAFEFNLDVNSGRPLGIGMGGFENTFNVGLTIWSHIANRSSSATSYLAPNFLARPNLDVLLNAQVSRLIQTGTDESSNLPAFRAVEYRLGDAESMQSVTASKEVILSAGTIGTPHILLNSGIGDSNSLEALNITPLVHLPDVGQNLGDHALLLNPWLVNSVSDHSRNHERSSYQPHHQTDTFESFLRDPEALQQVINQWATTGQGVLVDTIASHIGFFRIPKNNTMFSTMSDPTPGPNTPHYELLFANGLALPNAPSTGNFMGAATVVLSSTSRGSVMLRSNNPFDSPIIDPAILQSEFDRATMREAVKSAIKFATAPVWSDYVIRQFGPFEGVETDAQIDEYVTANAGTIWHPVGTAAMSPKGANTGVTDPDLRLKNVAGVRIADASVLPFVPSAHLQAIVYVFAERASDLIKSSYSDVSEKKQEENFAPGGVLDYRLDYQQWYDNQANNTSRLQEIERVSAVLKRKSDDTLSATQTFIKKARADITAAEVMIQELAKTNELLHAELMASKKEATHLAHVLGWVKGALGGVEGKK
ncbi:hypothetical protein C0991_010220, partial [Blastosporella zonata]